METSRCLYHLARPDDAERIGREGFDLGSSRIQAWAQGVYLASDEQTAELYGNLYLERERIEVTAAVLNPFLVEVPAGSYDSIAIMHDAIAAAFGVTARCRPDFVATDVGFV